MCLRDWNTGSGKRVVKVPSLTLLLLSRLDGEGKTEKWEKIRKSALSYSAVAVSVRW